MYLIAYQMKKIDSAFSEHLDSSKCSGGGCFDLFYLSSKIVPQVNLKLTKLKYLKNRRTLLKCALPSLPSGTALHITLSHIDLLHDTTDAIFRHCVK